ncbi:hypothetical protein TCDM_07470 [Trypanosoma cruzi Dm28c]|uniref:Uncharacterized protein n=1 Tax=Trypanosoma cruzi Dm28c TaxID=1416333 RepID=V5DAK1_TRYCR|nr:hypothetical protein TCDM_07470 [Trypanosoma cruzi Dm28c]
MPSDRHSHWDASFVTRCGRAFGGAGKEVRVRLVDRTTPCGNCIGVASAWAVRSVAEVRSVCRLSLSSSLKCWVAVPAHRGNWLSTAPGGAPRRGRHDNSAATAALAAHRAVCRASDRGGAGSSGGKRRFRARFFACLLWGVRAATTAYARDGGSQWS